MATLMNETKTSLRIRKAGKRGSAILALMFLVNVFSMESALAFMDTIRELERIGKAEQERKQKAAIGIIVGVALVIGVPLIYYVNTKACPNCGTRINDGAKVCKNCGKDFCKGN